MSNNTFSSIQEYIDTIPDERLPFFLKLLETIQNNIPKGFEQCINYNMIGFVVPHKQYPKGYHCDPKLPLPFINLANQKNFIALYHFGIYANPEILQWFTNEFPKHSKKKLDMGKSCIRFKHMDDIPHNLIAQLVKKISVQDWIDIYEHSRKP